jgi:hypothetical protein
MHAGLLVSLLDKLALSSPHGDCHRNDSAVTRINASLAVGCMLALVT